MAELAQELSIVERGDILVLKGYPDDTESEWHVNTAAHMGEGPNRRVAVILQAADVGEQWLTIALVRQGGEWSIDDFAAFEGEPPKGGGDEAAIPIDPSDIELVSIEG